MACPRSAIVSPGSPTECRYPVSCRLTTRVAAATGLSMTLAVARAVAVLARGADACAAPGPRISAPIAVHARALPSLRVLLRTAARMGAAAGGPDVCPGVCCRWRFTVTQQSTAIRSDGQDAFLT